jgi:antitoxin (DNA-binding transcriptional repressor) of toxin-antitoxin stability system
MKVLKDIEKGFSINITSRGKVIAKLIPADESIKMAEEKLTKIRKSAKIQDVTSPVSANWKADS